MLAIGFISFEGIAFNQADPGISLNFDQLEEQALQVNSFDKVEHRPPCALMVWIRILGSPLANAYLSVHQKVAYFWQWLSCSKRW